MSEAEERLRRISAEAAGFSVFMSLETSVIRMALNLIHVYRDQCHKSQCAGFQ